jgi:excisionase family DNA binding protein
MKGGVMVQVTYKRAEELLHQSEFQPRELARLLGTSEQFLFNEVWKGNLEAVKFGNDIVRFERSKVLAWLARRERR